jgi:hypothetical protein
MIISCPFLLRARSGSEKVVEKITTHISCSVTFLSKIYGPVKENELWRIRRNDELEAIIKVENIVRFINPYPANVENRVSS